jgi:hypothetical protein
MNLAALLEDIVFYPGVNDCCPLLLQSIQVSLLLLCILQFSYIRLAIQALLYLFIGFLLIGHSLPMLSLVFSLAVG